MVGPTVKTAVVNESKRQETIDG